MKKAVVISLIILMMFSVFANNIENANPSATSAANITKIKGENVSIAMPENGVRKAREGEPLRDGDIVMVGSGSEAQITSPNGSQSRALPNRVLTETELRLLRERPWGLYTELHSGYKIDMRDIAGICKPYGWPRGNNTIEGKSRFLTKSFFNNETGISEISIFNGSASVTAVRNGTVIDSCDIIGSLYFDEYGMPWANGQNITIYDNGTISEPVNVILNATKMAFTPYASDSEGNPKDFLAFNLGEDVYVYGLAALLRNNTDVSIYLMPYNISLTEYSPDKAVLSTTTMTDNWGNLPITYLWKPTESKYIGKYNIWIDRDNSGNYTEGDMVNYLKVQAPVGGVWVPVDKFVLLAPYIALASTILVATAAIAIYVKHVKRRNKKQ